MPILSRWPVPSPVRTIRVAEDASHAWVWLEDDSAWRLDLEDERFGPAVSASDETVTTFVSISPALRRPAAPVLQPETTAATAATETIQETAAPPAAEAVPEMDPSPDLKPGPQGTAAPIAEPVPKDQRNPEIQPGSEVRPDPGAPVATENPAPPARVPEPDPKPVLVSPGRIAGRVEGFEAGRTLFVTVLGPDNLLREAARVAVSPDGSFQIDGLKPGRYRVQPTGGGDSAIVSEPRFRSVEIREASEGLHLTFRIVRFL